MKSIYQVFATNKNLEVQGIVLDFGVAKFKVRRAGGSNREFNSTFANKTRAHTRAIQNGTLDPELSNAILIDVYFDAVMLGWEVTDKNGQPMMYSRENFKNLMTELPDLWATIREEAEKMKNFQDDEAETAGSELGKS